MSSFISRLQNLRQHRNTLLSYIAVALVLLLTVGGAASLAQAATGHQSQQQDFGDRPAEGKTFTVATDTTFAPFEFQKDGKFVGIDMDLLRAIAEDQGFEVEIQQLGFDGALQAVQSGQADAVMAGMGITDERQKTFDFSNAYYESGIQMAVATNSDISSYEDLEGKSVAVKTGTTGYAFAEKLSEKYNFKLNSFQDSADMYNDVAAGNSAAAFEDSPVLQFGIESGNVPLKIASEPESGDHYGFAVLKGQNPELIAAFNIGLKNVTESGEYQAILEEYLGDNAPDATKLAGGATTLGNQQIVDNGPGTLPEHPNFAIDTPKTNGKFVVATDTTFAPFEFVENGELVGIDMDLLRAIAANQGFEVEIRQLGFDGALSAVQSGQADAVMAGMGITEERQKTFDYSDPYYESGIQMGVAKDSDIKSYEDLEGKSVAVKTGTTGYEFATELSKKHNFKVNAFQDSADMYNDVATGNSAATFEDSPVLQYGIASGNVPLEIANDPEPGSDYGFAVLKGKNQELIEMFNEGLQNAKDTGVYQLILDRYLKAEGADAGGLFGLLQSAMPGLMKGLGYTLLATALSIFFALIVGTIFGVLKLSSNIFLRGLSSAYVNIFRGTPVIVQAFFFYFGVPTALGTNIDVLTAGVITLALNAGAYITEIVRGAVQSVDPGQMEAARSLGLGWGKSMQKVVMPQALKIMTPNLINQLIITLKDTSLLSVLGFAELTYQGRIVIASTFRSLEIWLLVGLMYFIVIWLLTMLSNWFDRKFNK